MTRAAQRPPVSVRYATDEEEAEARRRAAVAGLSLHAYIRRRTAGARVAAVTDALRATGHTKR